MYLVLIKQKARFFLSNEMLLSTLLKAIFYYLPAIYFGYLAGKTLSIASDIDSFEFYRIIAVILFLSCFFYKINSGYSLKHFLHLPISRIFFLCDLFVTFILKPINIFLTITVSVNILFSDIIFLYKFMFIMSYALLLVFIFHAYLNIKLFFTNNTLKTIIGLIFTIIIQSIIFIYIDVFNLVYFVTFLSIIHITYVLLYSKWIMNKIFYVSNN